MEALRLYFGDKLSIRAAGKHLGINESTIHQFFTHFATSALTWPLPADFSTSKLERRLYPGAPAKHRHRDIASSPVSPPMVVPHQKRQRTNDSGLPGSREAGRALGKKCAADGVAEHLVAGKGSSNVVSLRVERGVHVSGNSWDALNEFCRNGWVEIEIISPKTPCGWWHLTARIICSLDQPAGVKTRRSCIR